MPYSHNTTIELCGEKYAAIVLFEWDDSPFICSVEIQRKVKQFYNEKGEYAPITEIVNLSITKMLNDRQLCALADEITAEALCRAEEDRTEQRLLAIKQ